MYANAPRAIGAFCNRQMYMTMKIHIMNYGVGNLHSVAKALEDTGAEPIITKEPSELLGAACIVFPGVGAFGEASAHLSPCREQLKEKLNGGTPALGICLGMQILFDRSEESPGINGLSFIKGDVVRMDRMFADGQAQTRCRIPQMGWNSVERSVEDDIFRGIRNGERFYYANSFAARPKEDVVIASTEYGERHAAVVRKKNTYGVQFHPEKSSREGLLLLRNFVDFARSA